MEEKTAEEKQPFEAHPKLAELLLHAAHNWKTDGTWSATLEEINKVCATLDRYKEALEEIVGELPNPTLAVTKIIKDIASNALKQQ